MITLKANGNCFGFFPNERIVPAPCNFCPAARRCKAVTLTHGTDILADLLEHLKEQLPDTQYEDTDRLRELVEVLQNPRTVTLDQEAKAIGLKARLEDEPDIDV